MDNLLNNIKTCIKNKNYGQAVSEIDVALSIDPTTELKFYKAYSLGELGQYISSIEIYKRLIGINTNERYLHGICRVLDKVKNKEEVDIKYYKMLNEYLHSDENKSENYKKIMKFYESDLVKYNKELCIIFKNEYVKGLNKNNIISDDSTKTAVKNECKDNVKNKPIKNNQNVKTYVKNELRDKVKNKPSKNNQNVKTNVKNELRDIVDNNATENKQNSTTHVKNECKDIVDNNATKNDVKNESRDNLNNNNRKNECCGNSYYKFNRNNDFNILKNEECIDVNKYNDQIDFASKKYKKFLANEKLSIKTFISFLHKNEIFAWKKQDSNILEKNMFYDFEELKNEREKLYMRSSLRNIININFMDAMRYRVGKSYLMTQNLYFDIIMLKKIIERYNLDEIHVDIKNLHICLNEYNNEIENKLVDCFYEIEYYEENLILQFDELIENDKNIQFNKNSFDSNLNISDQKLVNKNKKHVNKNKEEDFNKNKEEDTNKNKEEDTNKNKEDTNKNKEEDTNKNRGDVKKNREDTNKNREDHIIKDVIKNIIEKNPEEQINLIDDIENNVTKKNAIKNIIKVKIENKVNDIKILKNEFNIFLQEYSFAFLVFLFDFNFLPNKILNLDFEITQKKLFVDQILFSPTFKLFKDKKIDFNDIYKFYEYLPEKIIEYKYYQLIFEYKRGFFNKCLLLCEDIVEFNDDFIYIYSVTLKHTTKDFDIIFKLIKSGNNNEFDIEKYLTYLKNISKCNKKKEYYNDFFINKDNCIYADDLMFELFYIIIKYYKEIIIDDLLISNFIEDKSKRYFLEGLNTNDINLLNKSFNMGFNDALKELAMVYMNNQEYKTAINYFIRCLEKNPIIYDFDILEFKENLNYEATDSEIIVLLAKCCMKIKKYKKALFYLLTHPKICAEYDLCCGKVFYLLKNYSKADFYLNKSNSNKETVISLYYLAKTNYYNKKHELAISQFEIIKKIIKAIIKTGSKTGSKTGIKNGIKTGSKTESKTKLKTGSKNGINGENVDVTTNENKTGSVSQATDNKSNKYIEKEQTSKVKKIDDNYEDKYLSLKNKTGNKTHITNKILWYYYLAFYEQAIVMAELKQYENALFVINSWIKNFTNILLHDINIDSNSIEKTKDNFVSKQDASKDISKTFVDNSNNNNKTLVNASSDNVNNDKTLVNASSDDFNIDKTLVDVSDSDSNKNNKTIKIINKKIKIINNVNYYKSIKELIDKNINTVVDVTNNKQTTKEFLHKTNISDATINLYEYFLYEKLRNLLFLFRYYYKYEKEIEELFLYEFNLVKKEVNELKIYFIIYKMYLTKENYEKKNELMKEIILQNKMSFYDKSIIHLSYNDFTGAIEHIHNYSNELEKFYLLSLIHFKKDKKIEAEIFLNKAKMIDHNHFLYYFLLIIYKKQYYLFEQLVLLYEIKFYDLFIFCLEEALINQDEIKEIDAIINILEDRKKDSRLFLHDEILGKLYLLKGDLCNAKMCLSETIFNNIYEKNKEYIDSYIFLVNGEYKEANNICQKLSEKVDNDYFNKYFEIVKKCYENEFVNEN